MNKVRVVEVIDSQSVRIAPKWVARRIGSKEKTAGDVIIIDKFRKMTPRHEDKIIKRLKILLLEKGVFLMNDHVEVNGDKISVVADIVLDRTEISYYFPEFKFEEETELV
ncbi:hypothetical protein [Sediminibacterium ginsengisoli]|uniref:Uncharacterized protein n=1 Tax=Sediminibacterium ginsengisoli TaxID=413434 RepID=A0A1T4KTI2_9BACT|nr:hypothetical protein [Sediminibacterium ginsengisoli]SJZ45742.1 hypothetical protein SAMN04488132_102103 [Sediminibacterium ginsengisoli]